MNMNSDREIIEGALALIEIENGWTQGAYWRDADGYQVLPAADSPSGWVRLRTEHVGAGGYRTRAEAGTKPCSFCLQGALRASADGWRFGQPGVAHEQVDRLESLVLQFANSAAAPGWASLPAFNDDARTTQADAVLALKRAAAHFEAQEHEQP
ncbi:DUF6197 family protein [Mycolicibacterium tusciae]|uniref:DUF6197 family protein n=1 Tax=Mycolicibacterium tusciae TaxID=75922 RepID=UPI00024A12DB|nr:hypothetical protein [Mycolicibacterium tusciae]